MITSGFLITAFATLFVVIDPPGLVPLFIALTRGMSVSRRRSLATRACIIAVGILAAFAFAHFDVPSAFRADVFGGLAHELPLNQLAALKFEIVSWAMARHDERNALSGIDVELDVPIPFIVLYPVHVSDDALGRL